MTRVHVRVSFTQISQDLIWKKRQALDQIILQKTLSSGLKNAMLNHHQNPQTKVNAKNENIFHTTVGFVARGELFLLVKEKETKVCFFEP